MTSTEYIRAAMQDGVAYMPANDNEHARQVQKNICAQARKMLVQVSTSVADVVFDHQFSMAVRIEHIPEPL